MTTKLHLHNDPTSNGDVHVEVFNTDGIEQQPKTILMPGDKVELWISTSSRLQIHETWPTKKIALADIEAVCVRHGMEPGAPIIDFITKLGE